MGPGARLLRLRIASSSHLLESHWAPVREVLAVLCEEAEAGRGFLLPGAENGLTVGCRLVGAEYGRLVAIDCESFQKCRLSMSKLDLRYVL
jgi:hypothetical protein